jgi:O-acetyl-ADP-ribose deacetylase (regulator of RNase III)
MSNDNRQGVQGWREFIAEKHDLLRAYISAYEKAVSRPIKAIEPGRVAEGVFRSWLAGSCQRVTA